MSSPQTWAMARVNSFLFALRNGRFQGGKHDTDLLPESHPLSSKDKEEKAMKNKDERHIINVEESDDSYTIEFAKHHGMEEEMEMEENESEKDEMESRPYHDEDEEKDKDRSNAEDIVYRTVDLSKASYIDEENRRVGM